ncbi:MAG: hypothetical protein JSS66_04885 [Armatimonadetes bacterium]|nr:hypothetical protein [Armatimonadota bacterium]
MKRQGRVFGKGNRRFAQSIINDPIKGGLQTIAPLLTGPSGAAANMASNAVSTVGEAAKAGEMGLPGGLQAGRAMGPTFRQMQALYDLADQYGMSRKEAEDFSHMLLQNGLQVAEQAALFDQLKSMMPTLGGSLRDVLDIATRAAIQYRAGSPADKVKKIIQILNELSQEYAKDPSFNIVSMFASAAKGHPEVLTGQMWLGAMVASVKRGESMPAYYARMSGLVTDMYSPAHARLAIENKKAAVAEALMRSEFLAQEAIQKKAWEEIYAPNFAHLTEMYRQWAQNPEEAFSIFGINGWPMIKKLSEAILTWGAKLSIFTQSLGMTSKSPLLKPTAESMVLREVVAQAMVDRATARKQQSDFEDIDEPAGAKGSASNARKTPVNPFIKPGTVQYDAQMSSFGNQSDAWKAMVATNAQAAPLLTKLASLDEMLKLQGDYRQGILYMSLERNIKPLRDAMLTQTGMQVGGGGDLSQVPNVTLLSPEDIKKTTEGARQIIAQINAKVAEYKSLFEQMYKLVAGAVNDPKFKDARSTAEAARQVIAGNLKVLAVDLHNTEVALLDYDTVLPALLNVTRLETQASVYENLREQIKAMTGNELVGQFGTTQYKMQKADGTDTVVSGPAPSQALMALYTRMAMQFKAAVGQINTVLGRGTMDASVKNAMVQRRKQLVAKIEEIKLRYTQLVSASLGTAAGGAPASLEKQVRLTQFFGNERFAETEEDMERSADEVIRQYFDDLLPGYGTLLEHPDKHRNETVQEVNEDKRRKRRKHFSHGDNSVG